MHEFCIVKTEGGDWAAMYMDGRLMAEGHTLDAHDVLDAISDIFPNNVSYAEIPDEIAEELGNMPQHLYDLRQDLKQM